jgi:hypothetical protein
MQPECCNTPAEDAVFCVEDGQVLVHHSLQLPVTAAAAAAAAAV